MSERSQSQILQTSAVRAASGPATTSLVLLLAATVVTMAQESPGARRDSLSLRPAKTNTFDSLSLKPRPRAPNPATNSPVANPSAGYLEAWSAIHNDETPTADAVAVDAYLKSEADPRALRFHVQEFIRRRPGAWLASSFQHYPSPTGDRAGAWKRVFPDLVAPGSDVLKRQVAFDALLRLFEGNPDQRAFHARLAEHANPGMLIRACRNVDLPESIRGSLAPATAGRLLKLSGEASNKGLAATASILALHAHLLAGKGLPEPTTLPAALALSGDRGTGAERAQHHAARIAAAIWPPLAPGAGESPRLHFLLFTDKAFAGIRLQKILGVLPAQVEQQTEAILKVSPPGTRELALSGAPPTLRDAGQGTEATWAERGGPELRAQLERVQAARKAEAEGIHSAGWARRFYNPEHYERELASLRGESLPFIHSTTVAQAQDGLNAALLRQGELMRDGVYIGSDHNRPGRVFVRELSSFDRRRLDFDIDVERRRLNDARLNEQYNQGLLAEYRGRERALRSKLDDAIRAIRDVEEGWAPRLKRLREQVELEEFKLRQIRGDGVPASEIAARHDAIRITELKRDRARRVEILKGWEATRGDITEAEAGAERLWRVWLTSAEGDGYVPPHIGGLPLP